MSENLDPNQRTPPIQEVLSPSAPSSNGVISNIRKPQQAETVHGKLFSHSAPNTSFIRKQHPSNKTLLLDCAPADINSNATDEDNLKRGDPRGTETDDFNGTRIGFDPEELRSHRVDVLWKVEKGRGLEADGISSCVMCPDEERPEKKFHQNKSRLIPQFQQRRPQKNLQEEDTSGTRVDQNDNPNLLVGKKSEDDHNIRLNIPGHDGDLLHGPRNDQQRLIRREPLSWPWHSGTYHMNIRFHSPEFRNHFSSKMLLIKALQWALALIWTFSAYHIRYFHDHQRDLAWTLYLASFILITTFLTVRSISLLNNQTSIFVLFVSTFCISHLSAMLHIHYNCSAVPIVLITLTLTYILTALTFSCIQVDVDSPTVFYPIFVYVIMTSVISFWFVLGMKTEIRYPLSKILGTWFPCALLSLMICSTEMLEIQALLRGSRLPLEPTDWVLATTFLL